MTDGRTYITPDYPETAHAEMQEWKDMGKGPFFAKPLPQPPKETPNPCKNCAGEGKLYLQFCGKGPTLEPLTVAKSSTFYQGDHLIGKGWYLVEKTRVYVCHHCEGSGKAQPQQSELGV